MLPPRHNHSPIPARRRARLRFLLAGTLALALLAAGTVSAEGETPGATAAGGSSTTGEASTSGSNSSTPPSSSSSSSSPTTTTAPAPEAEAPVGVHGQTAAPSAEAEPEAETPQASPPEGTETTATNAAPEVRTQSSQAQGAPGGAGGSSSLHGAGRRSTRANGAGKGKAGTGSSSAGKPSGSLAPAPSTLTPPGWAGFGSLGTPISGIPDFFIESFRVPPFLLPIYQAAGTAYDIPWQVLAAINEVETDYGRDLNLSSAGAEGWMQFLPSSWAQYGVDATGAGYEDPYNPADAIFAAARYLQAAGGAQNVRAAVYSYNHSAAYVESVMLRAQLLGGTPPELLSAITGLTESRFPVHAEAHFTDGFPTVGVNPGHPSRTLAGTVIYAQAGAPVIAVQDGQITAVGDSPALGRYISLRDAYGNTYTYAQLGGVAALYPVLEPRVDSAVSARIRRPGGERASRGAVAALPPSTPASAGVQPHSPLSQGAVSSGLAMGAASALETPPAPAPVAPPPTLPAPPAASAAPRVFRAGPNEVYLHALVPGVQVLAGTVLGHIGAAGEPETSTTGVPAAQSGVAGEGPHMLFQIRPAGEGAPLIDPKPILDGWVRLEETSVFRAKGENPFLATSPTVGQVLLESKPQLEQQVLRDPGVHLPACERGAVRAGEVDRRVLATLEFLSVSGLSPKVSAAGCGHKTGNAGTGNAVGSVGEQLDISAINDTPIAGHEGPGSVTDIAVRRLLRLQGTMKPTEIVSASSYPGTDNTLTLPGYHGLIHVAFASPFSVTSSRRGARVATAVSSPLSPSQWLQLIAQIGEIPEPEVSGKPSAAAIPDPGTNSPTVGGSAAGADAAAGTVGGGAAGGSPTTTSPAALLGGGSSSNNAGGG
jgi:hypothetical protein